jgi:hypothetical protein
MNLIVSQLLLGHMNSFAIFLFVAIALHASGFCFTSNHRRIITRLQPLQNTLAEKLGGIVEFISGQTSITESNIEVTLKVSI